MTTRKKSNTAKPAAPTYRALGILIQESADANQDAYDKREQASGVTLSLADTALHSQDKLCKDIRADVLAWADGSGEYESKVVRGQWSNAILRTCPKWSEAQDAFESAKASEKSAKTDQTRDKYKALAAVAQKDRRRYENPLQHCLATTAGAMRIALRNDVPLTDVRVDKGRMVIGQDDEGKPRSFAMSQLRKFKSGITDSGGAPEDSARPKVVAQDTDLNTHAAILISILTDDAFAATKLDKAVVDNMDKLVIAWSKQRDSLPIPTNEDIAKLNADLFNKKAA